MEQQVAWVTGASGGIGSAIALQLAQDGFSVAVCYHTNQHKANEVVDQCRAYGVNACAFALDVSDETAVTQIYQAIHFSLGKPAIVVHAAGHTEVGLLQDASIDSYTRLMDVHVKGAFLLARSVLPYQLQQRWGRIIFISSVWGSVGGAMEALYSGAKAAQHGIAKALAKEVAASGITVNVVAPGAVNTPLLDDQLTSEEQSVLADDIPVGRLGNPSEIAAMVAFLCRKDADYITGQVIQIDGGWYA
jgi:3-oxoacyl-[acyl-carrier protein] reductase